MTVQIQKPAAGLSRFDLVIAPEHDGIEGANVLSTRGALHRITPELLSRNAQALAPRLAGLQRPLIAVLLGGSNAVYRLEAEEMPILAEQLASAARRTGGSLAVTPSRRTGADVLHILSERLQGVPHFIWDGQGENPYFGLLGLADFIVVTCDSVNMVSEACATGKPVYVVDLPGGSAKFDTFHRRLREAGMTRPFAGPLEPFSYTPPDDVKAAAARIGQMLAARVRQAA